MVQELKMFIYLAKLEIYISTCVFILGHIDEYRVMYATFAIRDMAEQTGKLNYKYIDPNVSCIADFIWPEHG